MKKIQALILLILPLLNVFGADSNWRIHPIFNEAASHVIETPNYVYFTSRQMHNQASSSLYSLFRYDKKSEELLPLSTSNILNSNSVRDIIYNPNKGYIAVIYKDYTIDLLYNDGHVENIPQYRQSNISYSKGINSMSIDPNSNRIYLATDFGYISINDEKNEIAESRIYGEPLQAFCRLGDDYIAILGKELKMSPINDPRLSLDAYQTVATFDDPQTIFPLTDNFGVLVIGAGNQKYYKKLINGENGLEIEDLFNGITYNIDYTNNGLVVTAQNTIYLISRDGSVSKISRPEIYGATAGISTNMLDIWNVAANKGLNSIKISGDQWNVTHDWMLPNAPGTYITTSYNTHPEYGLMLLNYGYLPSTFSFNNSNPLQLCSYKKGRWTNFGTPFTNPDRANILLGINDFVIDPDNSNYVYITSYHTGMMRLNLKDPKDIIHLSYSNDNDADNDGFVVFPLLPNKNIKYTNISSVFFDKQGNLWMRYPNYDKKESDNPSYFIWLAADRKATTSANNFYMPYSIDFDVYCPVTNLGMSIPLLNTGNGMMVTTSGIWPDKLVFIDTNGTPLDTNDDKYYSIPEFIDSDGNVIEMERITCLWEDPSTGYLWVGHNTGVFYMVPSQVKNGNDVVYKLKVPRNDGTNLADYLLEGVGVNGITADSEGRKWFSTNGGGVICTSSDGREILEEFTMANSPLPDDAVYGIGYNSNDNSLIISTNQGYAEYFLPVSQSSSTKADIKAYPNPVRPEFSGYVTITDIPTGSFVKIVDVAGHLVKDLGIMSGFEMLWDISDSNFNRVRSGVYHIMISPSDETSSYSTVGKILVVS